MVSVVNKVFYLITVIANTEIQAHSLSSKYGIQYSALPTVVGTKEVDHNLPVSELLISYSQGLFIEERT